MKPITTNNKSKIVTLRFILGKDSKSGLKNKGKTPSIIIILSTK